MRCVRCAFTILLLLLISAGVKVFAMNTGFSTEFLSEDNVNTVLKNVKISVLPDEPQKKPIECFDVNENGMVAIGCGDSEYKTVCIYTSDGDFQYGYTFKCSGNFGVEFRKNIVNIYLVRSDVAIAVNPVGEVKSILEIQNTSQNNSYWNNNVFLTRRKVGDIEYTLKNDMGIFNMFASSYSQLIITNTNGEKSVIYDVSSAQFLNMAAVFVVVLVFTCLVVAVVIGQLIKLKRDACG